MNTTDHTLETVRLDATALALRVRDGSVTPRQVVEQHLARIAELDSELHAFQVVDSARALAEADTLAARSDLHTLPLAGVPVAIKDNIDVAGLPTRHGSKATSDAPAARDDELVRRLRNAGAIVIGKTTMPELAAWAFGESAAFGVTRNPWDLQRSPGGSTSGGAVAVAAGMAALAVGSDGGGSLRVPAGYCGVVGFKPAAGVVPIARGAAEHWCGLTSFGPITRTVRDAALAVEVLADDVLADDALADGVLAPASSLGTGTGSLRIGTLLASPSPVSRPHATVRAAVEDAAAALSDAGHSVTTLRHRYPAQLVPWWEHRWFAGVAREVAALQLAPDELEPRTRRMAARGRLIERLGGPRPAIAERWRAKATTWFQEVDVLLTPTTALPAPAAEGMTGRGYLATLMPAAKNISYTQAWNLAGFPAITVPVGLDSDGMPRSVQLVTVPGRQAQLYAAAAGVERAFGPLWM